MKEMDIEIVRKAQQGDSPSLEKLFDSLKDDVFNISTKFFFPFHDAEDATQEILVKILEKLHSLRDPGRFIPWSYRIAVNHLKTMVVKQKSIPISFELMEADSRSHHSTPDQFIEEEEKQRLVVELKISCTTAMLFCLSTDERIAFIFKELFDISGTLAEDILEISSGTFRKRVSRANKKIESYMDKNCSLLGDQGNCNCRSRVAYALSQGRIAKGRLQYSSEEYVKEQLNVKKFLSEMEQLDDLSQVYGQNPLYRAPERLEDFLKKTLESKKMEILGSLG